MDNIDFCVHQAVLCKFHFNLILPCRSFEAVPAARAIANLVSKLSAVTFQAQQYRERKLFSSGRIASSHLPLVRTHRRTTVILVQ